ncbi:MAG: glycosyltransferase family A protein [Pseudomonadales bacterium]
MWQLQETLPFNLRLIGDNEISLVDYGSDDGLNEWILANFQSNILDGSLRYFSVTSPTVWSAPHAKNLAHRISSGEFLYNLDADNFISEADIQATHEVSAIENQAIHQFSQVHGDGSYGRIGLRRAHFQQLGGYDEGLLPMSEQDVDLIKRMALLGLKTVKAPLQSKAAIENSMQDKLVNTGSSEQTDYDELQRINKEIINWKLAHYGAVRTGGFASFDGVFNGKKKMRIDGFNQDHRLAD